MPKLTFAVLPKLAKGFVVSFEHPTTLNISECAAFIYSRYGYDHNNAIIELVEQEVRCVEVVQKYEHVFDIAFMVTTHLTVDEILEPKNLPLLISALEQRVKSIRENPADAFGHVNTTNV